MKKISLNTLLILLFVLSVSAQTKVFKWEDEICGFEGKYDSKKYSEQELADTQKLIASVGWIPLFTNTTAASPGDIKDLSLAKLDEEYRQRSAELKGLKLVKGKYWEDLRQAKLRELDQYYQLSRVTISAYTEPAVLTRFKQAECCLDFYAEPLIKGGEYLAAAWLKVNMDSRNRNASPETLKSVFEAQNASPDRLDHARVEVMSFGWWNCALRSLDMVEDDESFDVNFKKLFISVKEECEISLASSAS